MKISEAKSVKRQEDTFLDVLFSNLKSKELPFTKISPYKKMLNEGYLLDQYDEYQAYLKVKTRDLGSMNQADLNRIVSHLTDLCKVYNEPFKIMSMTYLTETTQQQFFWKGRVNKYRKILLSKDISQKDINRYENMLKLAIDNLRRVNWVEDNLTELTFFIVVYGKNIKELETHVRDMTRYGGKQFGLSQIKGKKLQDIVTRLNNMNTES